MNYAVASICFHITSTACTRNRQRKMSASTADEADSKAKSTLQFSPLNANGSADASGHGSGLYASDRDTQRGNADGDDGGSAGAVCSAPIGVQHPKRRSMAPIAPLAETLMPV
jgi:hypothetical protein